MRAGVAEILTLEVDAGAPRVLGETRGEEERRGAAGVVAEQGAEPGPEALIPPGARVRGLQLQEGRHERLRHEPTAEAAEVSGRVRQPPHAAPRAAATKRRILSASLRPGVASTPESTSTA